MALRLFRTTGYSTLLMPGEARIAPHPARLVLFASLWLGVVGNVAVWRALAGALDWRTAVAVAALVGGACGVAFSILGWRRTLKPAITIALIAGALIAAGLWNQRLPIETLWQGPPRTLLPPWTSFMRWEVLLMVLLLAVVPIVWLWNHAVRRLPGQAQMQSNVLGAVFGAVVFAVGLFLLRA